MSIPPSPQDDAVIKALGALIDVTYTLMRQIRELQTTQGGCTYDALAAILVQKFELSLPEAQQRVWQVITHFSHVEYDGSVLRLVEPAPPTIAETVAGWKAMAAGLKPKPHYVSLGSRALPIETVRFEQFRPKRSAAKWLKGAPECVIACYDNGERTADRYTVVFGGLLWDTDFARANWQAGLDPRLTLCLSISVHSDYPQGVSMWSQCLRGSHLGRKICWSDLPQPIRAHIIMRVNAV